MAARAGDRGRLADIIGTGAGNRLSLRAIIRSVPAGSDRRPARLAAGLTGLRKIDKKNGGAEAPPPDLDA